MELINIAPNAWKMTTEKGTVVLVYKTRNKDHWFSVEGVPDSLKNNILKTAYTSGTQNSYNRVECREAAIKFCKEHNL